MCIHTGNGLVSDLEDFQIKKTISITFLDIGKLSLSGDFISPVSLIMLIVISYLTLWIPIMAHRNISP